MAKITEEPVMMGRPHRIMTDEGEQIITSLVNSFRSGIFTKQACALAGISTQAYRLWQRKGRTAEIKQDNGEELTRLEKTYLDFMNRVLKARATYSKFNMAVIQQASIGRVPGGGDTKPDWKAAAWLQERSFPQEYGPLNQHRIEMNQKIDVEVNHLDGSNSGSAILFDIAKSLGLEIVSGNVFAAGTGITDQSDGGVPGDRDGNVSTDEADPSAS